MIDDDVIDSDLKEKIDDFFINFENINDLKNITNTSTDDEIIIFIEETFNKLLGRYPDNDEIIYYMNILKYDGITKEKLIDILKDLNEYKNVVNNISFGRFTPSLGDMHDNDKYKNFKIPGFHESNKYNKELYK